jgi:hypothetical protein
VAGGSYIIWYENLSILDNAEHNSLEFNVFPNPTDSMLNIESKTSIVNVTIHTITGLVVVDKQDENGIHEVYLNKFDQGVYLIKIIDENGEIGVKKIVKK